MTRLPWREAGEGVLVLRYPVLDVNVTLVRGDGAALLVDTLATPRQARDLLEHVRQVTDDALSIVNTHHHFDHCFGNAVVAAAHPGCAIWAHTATADLLRREGARLVRSVAERWLPREAGLDPTLADTVLLPPGNTVAREVDLTVGG